jgi:hypothetical protein
MTIPFVTNCQRSTKKILRSSTRLAIFCVSGLIAFLWSIQFIVSVPLSVITHEIRRSWPIVDYPMYRIPHFEGDKIPRLAVVGIRDNTEEIDIRPEDIGGGYWHFQVFVRAVASPDEDVIRDMVRMYETRHNVRLAALRVENRPLLWKSTKVEGVPVEILRTYPLSAALHNSTIP